MKLASNPQTTKTADFPSPVLTFLRSAKESSVFPSERRQASHQPLGDEKMVHRDLGAAEALWHLPPAHGSCQCGCKVRSGKKRGLGLIEETGNQDRRT